MVRTSGQDDDLLTRFAAGDPYSVLADLERSPRALSSIIIIERNDNGGHVSPGRLGVCDLTYRMGKQNAQPPSARAELSYQPRWEDVPGALWDAGPEIERVRLTSDSARRPCWPAPCGRCRPCA